MFKYFFVLFVVLGLTGCDVQSGRFISTGDSLNPLLTPVGSIDIIDGYETGKESINDQHLLYILIVAQGVQEIGSSSSSDYDKYFTKLDHTWNTDKGMITVSIVWNRLKDIVIIGKQEFMRGEGNTFVVRANTNGEISGEQLPSLNSPSNVEQVFQYIHQHLPNDELISSIKLYK